MGNEYFRQRWFRNTIENFLQGMIILTVFVVTVVTVLGVIWLFVNNFIVFAILGITAFIFEVSALFAYFY